MELNELDSIVGVSSFSYHGGMQWGQPSTANGPSLKGPISFLDDSVTEKYSHYLPTFGRTELILYTGDTCSQCV